MNSILPKTRSDTKLLFQRFIVRFVFHSNPNSQNIISFNDASPARTRLRRAIDVDHGDVFKFEKKKKLKVKWKISSRIEYGGLVTKVSRLYAGP